jgi:hypothetical protein
VGKWAKDLKIIDIGIGCGSFIKEALARDLNIFGYDINPCGIHWLHKHAIFHDPYKGANGIMCWTFWDSLEHIPEPQKILENIPTGAYVFVSMPIFDGLEDVTKSKHYRPNEHYYYFTAMGFVRWMRRYKLRLTKCYWFEQEAGREKIRTFLFEKLAVLGDPIGGDNYDGLGLAGDYHTSQRHKG